VPTVDGGFNRIHFGYIDRAGQQVIPPDFGWANSFSEGYAFAIVGYNGLMAVIDKHATPVTPYEFDQGLAEFHEGLAPVRTNKLYGYIDPTGAWVIPPQFDGASLLVPEKRVWIHRQAWKHHLEGSAPQRAQTPLIPANSQFSTPILWRRLPGDAP
jgi:hypothetical protein